MTEEKKAVVPKLKNPALRKELKGDLDIDRNGQVELCVKHAKREIKKLQAVVLGRLEEFQRNTKHFFLTLFSVDDLPTDIETMFKMCYSFSPRREACIGILRDPKNLAARESCWFKCIQRGPIVTNHRGEWFDGLNRLSVPGLKLADEESKHNSVRQNLMTFLISFDKSKGVEEKRMRTFVEDENMWIGLESEESWFFDSIVLPWFYFSKYIRKPLVEFIKMKTEAAIAVVANGMTQIVKISFAADRKHLKVEEVVKYQKELERYLLSCFGDPSEMVFNHAFKRDFATGYFYLSACEWLDYMVADLEELDAEFWKVDEVKDAELPGHMTTEYAIEMKMLSEAEAAQKTKTEAETAENTKTETETAQKTKTLSVRDWLKSTNADEAAQNAMIQLSLKDIDQISAFEWLDRVIRESAIQQSTPALSVKAIRKRATQQSTPALSVKGVTTVFDQLMLSAREWLANALVANKVREATNKIKLKIELMFDAFPADLVNCFEEFRVFQTQTESYVAKHREDPPEKQFNSEGFNNCIFSVLHYNAIRDDENNRFDLNQLFIILWACYRDIAVSAFKTAMELAKQLWFVKHNTTRHVKLISETTPDDDEPAPARPVEKPKPKPKLGNTLIDALNDITKNKLDNITLAAGEWSGILLSIVVVVQTCVSLDEYESLAKKIPTSIVPTVAMMIEKIIETKLSEHKQSESKEEEEKETPEDESNETDTDWTLNLEHFRDDGTKSGFPTWVDAVFECRLYESLIKYDTTTLGADIDKDAETIEDELHKAEEGMTISFRSALELTDKLRRAAQFLKITDKATLKRLNLNEFHTKSLTACRCEANKISFQKTKKSKSKEILFFFSSSSCRPSSMAEMNELDLFKLSISTIGLCDISLKNRSFIFGTDSRFKLVAKDDEGDRRMLDFIREERIRTVAQRLQFAKFNSEYQPFFDDMFVLFALPEDQSKKTAEEVKQYFHSLKLEDRFVCCDFLIVLSIACTEQIRSSKNLSSEQRQAAQSSKASSVFYTTAKVDFRAPKKRKPKLWKKKTNWRRCSTTRLRTSEQSWIQKSKKKRESACCCRT